MKCANVGHSVVPRIGDGSASISSIWSSVLAYVWHLMLFSSTRMYLHHLALHVESDRPINTSVCPSVRPSFNSWSVYECRVITLQPLGIDLCNFKERFIPSRPCGMNKNDNS